MNIRNAFITTMNHGISVLEMLRSEAAEHGVETAATTMGLDLRTMRRHLRTEEFFRPPQLHNAADSARLSLNALGAIAGQVNKLGKKYPERISLGLKLIDAVKGQSIDAAMAICKKEVESIVIAERRQRTKELVKIQPQPNVFGQRNISMVLNEATVTTLQRQLQTQVNQLRSQRRCSYAAAWAEVIVQKLLAAGPTAHETQLKSAVPCYMLALDDPYYYSDGIISTADGEAVPWHEAVNTKLAKQGYVLVMAKQRDGGYPMAARFEIERFATEEQRFVATTETMGCPWPDCERPANECQVHHIRAFSQDGATAQTNLTPLCATHNGANDDNPARPRNGRVERCPNTGRVGYRYRAGQPLKFNWQPRRVKGWREVALRLLV